MPQAKLELKPYLIASDADLVEQFRALVSLDDVAHLLEVPSRFLRWILYGARLRSHYRENTIPKTRGGSRRICVPPKNLRILQDKLLRVLSLVYEPKPCVTGFARKRSILDNAHPHVGKRYVLNFDLNDFFPTIHFGRVRGILQSPPYSLGRKASLVMAQIACHDDGHLPQGAPTSPILANIVCAPLDTAMMDIARRRRLRYSRYADDISLSTTQRNFPQTIATIDDDGVCHLGAEVLKTVRDHGFSIRDGKTRLRTPLRRQKVTGLIVNEFANVTRRYIRELRALIHCCNSEGCNAAAVKYSEKHDRTIQSEPSAWIVNVIRGKLAYISMVRGNEDHVVRRLRLEAGQIGASALVSPIPLDKQLGQPIRRRTRRAPNWSLWVNRYRDCVFRLRCNDTETAGENFATAFRVGPSRFMTAGHNALCRQSDHGVVYRQLQLDLPLNEPIELIGVKAQLGEQGAVDLAIATAELPAGWPPIYVPTQERLPMVGEEIIALGFPDVPFREVIPIAIDPQAGAML